MAYESDLFESAFECGGLLVRSGFSAILALILYVMFFPGLYVHRSRYPAVLSERVERENRQREIALAMEEEMATVMDAAKK